MDETEKFNSTKISFALFKSAATPHNMSKAISFSRESNPSSTICDLRATARPCRWIFNIYSL